MSQLFDILKNIFDIIQAIWDFVASAFEGAIQCAESAMHFLTLIDDVIASMPAITIPFMTATVGVIIVYFVLGLVTGGQS